MSNLDELKQKKIRKKVSEYQFIEDKTERDKVKKKRANGLNEKVNILIYDFFKTTSQTNDLI